MKHLFKIGGALLLTAGVAAQAQIINLSDDDNFAGAGQYNPYVGPGAYPGTTASDFWNGFGVESNGNNPTPTTGLLSTSTGTPTALTYSISYLANNGAENSSYQGTPAYLFSETALVNNGGIGTLTLQNVPNTSYNLYLYGANFDGTRGAQFTVNSGTAVNGLSATVNPYTGGGSGPLDTFVLGQDYVEFTGVTPDVNGNIDITWTQYAGDNMTGEGDFNGISLVTASVPEPTTLALLGAGCASVLLIRRRK